jgi:hypothetical protein
LRNHENAREAARLEKLSALRSPVALPGTIVADRLSQAQLFDE